jgi:hypothetical protein
LTFEKKQLRDENGSLNTDLTQLLRGGDGKQWLNTVENLRKEKTETVKK